jgi:hypothetical protein
MTNYSFTLFPGSSGSYGFAGVGSNAISLSFSLQQLYINFGPSANSVGMPDFTDFTNLFAQYRITGAEVMMFFNRNAESAATTSSTLPVIAFANDYTGNTQFTSIAGPLEYSDCRLIQLGNTRGESPAVRLKIRPRPAAELSDFGVAPAMSPSEGTWISSTYPDVPHYCIKGWYDNQTAGAAVSPCGEIFLYVRLSIECRQPK